MKTNVTHSQVAGRLLAVRQKGFTPSSTGQVGRVTPCAPQSATNFPNGAHGVTRPTLCRNLFVTVLAVAAMALSACVAWAQPTTTFTKITTGPVVTNLGQGWGAAWGDIDNDGFIDLVVVNEGADFLYRNNRDGTFTSITNSPVVRSASDFGGGLSFSDYDNDGDLDLMVVVYGRPPNTLFRNEGDGTFAMTDPNTLPSNGDEDGVSWGDFDNDGFLDLLITSDPNPSVRLHRNNGDGTFREVTSTSGLDQRVGYALAGVWGDIDNDGDLDLVVTYWLGGGRNSIYRNNGNGTFAKILEGDAGYFFGAAWGDYDNDGDLDLFIVQGGGSTLGNDVLYRNDGNGAFTKMAANLVGPLVADNQPGAGCAWADYDNDGWLDLYVANPGLSTSGGESGRKNLLYHNNGDGSFTQVTTGSPVNDVATSASCIWGDYNNDGFMDLFVANGGHTGRQRDFLYRNDGNSNAWLKLKLIGTVSNRSAIGAKVRVKATINGTSFWQMREISGGDGSFSQNDIRPNFGLGDASRVETLRIEWPSGQVQELANVPANQTLILQEPPRLEPTVKVLNGMVELKVRGWKGFTYAIEGSSNLTTWQRLGTVTNLTGTLQATDVDAGGGPQRFYRLVVP